MIKRRLCVILLLLTLMPFGTVAALQVVSRSYTVASGSVVAAGDLVSTMGDQDTVTLANTDNGSRLVGVVVSAGQSAVAINGTNAQNTVQVATSGTCNVFVSTVGGDIHAGDAIAVSPLNGIGMRAQGTLRTIGIAQADFTSSDANTKSYSVKDQGGGTHQVALGTVAVMIGIGSGSGLAADAGVVGNLQTTAGVIVGHPVSALQAILAFLVAIIAVGSLIALVYGSIKGGVSAIGRNPLARGSIYKSLAQVIAMACLIVVVAGAMLYFTLR